MCRAAASKHLAWPSAVEVEISSFDVVDGSRRIYIHPMVSESGSAVSGTNDDDSALVAVVGRA